MLGLSPRRSGIQVWCFIGMLGSDYSLQRPIYSIKNDMKIFGWDTPGRVQHMRGQKACSIGHKNAPARRGFSLAPETF